MSAQSPSLLLDHILYKLMFIQCGNGVHVRAHFNPFVLSFFYSETVLTAITHLNTPRCDPCTHIQAEQC